MDTPELSRPSLKESLEFFSKYRDLVFSTSPYMGNYKPGLEIGPVDPWTSCNPYASRTEQWKLFFTVDRKVMFPEHPFQDGMLPGTYRMWDYILTSGISKLRSGSMLVANNTARSLQPVRDIVGLNDYWTENMKHNFSFDVPDSRYIVDFRQLPDGSRMLEAAHALAHYRCNSRIVETSSRLKLHGRLTDEFHKAAAEIAIGYHMGIPIDVVSTGPDVPMAYGLQARPSTVLGFDIDLPVLRVPVRKNMLSTVNRTLAYVCAVVQVGHDPAKMVNGAGGANHAQDRWAYQPVRVFIAGWETAAWMSMQNLVHPESSYWHGKDTQCDYASHCKDLLPAISLDYYVKLGEEHMKSNAQQYMGVKEWLYSDGCKAMVENSPPLPCNTCMHMYNDFAGGVTPPRGPRPFRQKKMPLDWVAYFVKYAKAMKLITQGKKVMYHDRRSFRADMAERRRNFKQAITETRRKIRARKKW